MERKTVRAVVEGGFWLVYQSLVKERVIPYQWRAMNDEIHGAPKSHSVENFRVAAGTSTDEYSGMVFQDSDLYKWLEAAGNVEIDDSEISDSIQRWVDEAVDLIEGAQLSDGYVNTYFSVNDRERRWKNLRDGHELYCAGHLIEAAVSLAQGGRNTKLLKVAERFADLIDRTFGNEEGKTPGYPGHEEIELALVKLYKLTGERRYLERARYFVESRGRSPSYFYTEASDLNFAPVFDERPVEYYQDHLPIREQHDAVGHAVRAMYLYIAAADLAIDSGDSELAATCDRLWDSATGRKMYVTGGIGSSWVQEAFGADFDLPNDTAYAETCAAIGLFLFSSRMLRLHNEAKYADVMERCLYNGILSGLSLDGEAYFYVNPLDVQPNVCDANPSYRTVKYRRQAWYGCACCPPNVARTLTGLGDHFYHFKDATLYADLYHEGSVSFLHAGTSVTVHQRTEYPWDGRVALEVVAEVPVRLTLALRAPEWCRRIVLAVNDTVANVEKSADGYLHLDREWKTGDMVRLEMHMEAVRVHADPRVRAASGKTAIQRGPVVYCLEEADNGRHLCDIRLPHEAILEEAKEPELLGGIVAIQTEGISTVDAGKDRSPSYREYSERRSTAARSLTFIPYYAWANRTPGEMAVWVRE